MYLSISFIHFNIFFEEKKRIEHFAQTKSKTQREAEKEREREGSDLSLIQIHNINFECTKEGFT